MPPDVRTPPMYAQDVDPHIGSKETLKELSRQLHARDMCLIIDIVANHVRQMTVQPDYSPGAIKTYIGPKGINPFDKDEPQLYRHGWELDLDCPRKLRESEGQGCGQNLILPAGPLIEGHCKPCIDQCMRKLHVAIAPLLPCSMQAATPHQSRHAELLGSWTLRGRNHVPFSTLRGAFFQGVRGCSMHRDLPGNPPPLPLKYTSSLLMKAPPNWGRLLKTRLASSCTFVSFRWDWGGCQNARSSHTYL